MNSTLRVPFSYVVLRYMHDTFTREFVNVGVLLCAPHRGFIGFERLQILDRVKCMFPSLDPEFLHDSLCFLSSRAQELGAAKPAASHEEHPAAAIATMLLPHDDSALQWSEPGGGVTANPQETLSELFDRLVGRYLKPA